MCLFNADSVIEKGSLVSTMSMSSWFSCILHAIACATAVFQTTTSPTPVTWLIAKRNAHTDHF